MNKGKILVVGSLAYDHVMQFDGKFEDVMIKGNFNMAFTASSRVLCHGGCAGNISYSLKLLGEDAMIMTVVGYDFDEYEKWLIDNQIDISLVYKSERMLTASAFIMTDKEQDQLTIFDPGAMNSVIKEHNLDKNTADNITAAIISPDTPDRMIKLADQCRALNIPYIFDPAQQIGMFENLDLLNAAKNADVLMVNEYEAKLLIKKLGIDRDELIRLSPTYIETRGEKGAFIRDGYNEFNIMAVKPDHLIDPTGCGDAFRAGILAGLRRGYKIDKAAKMGALTATYSIEQFGTQAHSFSMKEFGARFEEQFGEKIDFEKKA